MYHDNKSYVTEIQPLCFVWMCHPWHLVSECFSTIWLPVIYNFAVKFIAFTVLLMYFVSTNCTTIWNQQSKLKMHRYVFMCLYLQLKVLYVLSMVCLITREDNKLHGSTWKQSWQGIHVVILYSTNSGRENWQIWQIKANVLALQIYVSFNLRTLNIHGNKFAKFSSPTRIVHFSPARILCYTVYMVHTYLLWTSTRIRSTTFIYVRKLLPCRTQTL